MFDADTPLTDDYLRSELEHCDTPGCYLCRLSRELLFARSALKAKLLRHAAAIHPPLEGTPAEAVVGPIFRRYVAHASDDDLIALEAAIREEIAERAALAPETSPPQ